jgi:hypothetical protein
MRNAEKKLAAVLAATQLYMRQEEEEQEACRPQALPPGSSLPPEPGLWAQSARLEMMTGHRMMQMRAFACTR